MIVNEVTNLSKRDERTNTSRKKRERVGNEMMTQAKKRKKVKCVWEFIADRANLGG